MAIVVNNPANSGDGGGGFLVGVIVLIGFVIGLIYFGLPEVRRMVSGSQNSPQIVVPSTLDVNVKQAN